MDNYVCMDEYKWEPVAGVSCCTQVTSLNAFFAVIVTSINT